MATDPDARPAEWSVAYLRQAYSDLRAEADALKVERDALRKENKRLRKALARADFYRGAEAKESGSA